MQTPTDLDDGDAPVALRTPLYPIISAFGLLIVVAAFLPWAGVSAADRSGDATAISGLDAGGWGLSAIVVGVAIAVLADVGYFWNPFSDPEAMFLTAFGAATTLAAVLKILDPASLIVGASDFDGPDVGARIGLWLVLLGGVATMLGGAWILYSRPKAQARLVRQA